MQESSGEARALSPGESWQTIHSTMEASRSSMYLTGVTTIVLLWGAIASLGILSQHAIATLATEFAADRPWFPGPLWGVLAAAGIVGSAIIGHRAGRENAAGGAMRSAGIRVFLFWFAVLAAAFAIPAAAGLWNADGAEKIHGVTIGIVALGHVLFGIMVRPAIAVVGVGIAAAFYIPDSLAGDAAAGRDGSFLIDAGHGERGMDAQERRAVIDDVALDETIHQSTRLRIMTMLVSLPESDRLAYGFIQRTLDLTGGNLTTHLRKLEDADFLAITKEFRDSKPQTWIQVTPAGRQAFAEYLANLQKALNWRPG